MKKSIFILAALFAATIVNAQITLEKVIQGQVYFPTTNQGGLSWNDLVYGDIMILTRYDSDENQGYATIYDAYTYEEYLSDAPFEYNVTTLFAKGYLTNDNRVTYLTAIENDNSFHLYVRNLNNENIADLGEVEGRLSERTIYKWSDGSAQLIIKTYDDSDQPYTYIYSLPGDGMTTAISTPSSPKRSARKIAKGGQVLIETEANTYSLQGQEVK